MKTKSWCEEKPVFYIYELLLKSLSDEEIQYQLKGRLVSKDYVKFETMYFELPFSDKWVGIPTCFGINQQSNNRRKEMEDRTPLTIETRENILIIHSPSFYIGKHNSYDIVGSYVVNKKDDDKVYNSLKDDTYKSLRISLCVDKEEKIENIKVIKCPNIRKNWLTFYSFLSIIVLFIGIFSVIDSIKNNWDYILNADFISKSVLIVYGTISLSAIALFIHVVIKCVSQYIILIKMEKFGIPRKTKIVSDTLLIPKIIEYMTGSEKVDNIL